MFGLLLLTMTAAGLAFGKAAMPGFLIDKPDVANDIEGNGLIFGDSLDFVEERPCVMKIHSVKEVKGHCARGRSGIVSCMAGPYLHPEHQECTLIR